MLQNVFGIPYCKQISCCVGICVSPLSDGSIYLTEMSLEHGARHVVLRDLGNVFSCFKCVSDCALDQHHATLQRINT
jgi:hypothetical protein